MMRDYKNCVSGKPEFVALWHRICDESEEKERNWIESLRQKGFKAAHPNDGWIDREKNEVQLVYPQFNDGVNIGDLVMLGSSHDDKRLRPIRLIERLDTIIPNLLKWKFEDILVEDGRRIMG